MLIFPPSHSSAPALAGLNLLLVTAAGMNLINQQGRLESLVTSSDLIIAALLVLNAALMILRAPTRASWQVATGLSFLLALLTLT